MDQGQLICTKVGHDSQPIQGICMNLSCSADQKICCINCLQTIHAQCTMTQFCQTKQFLQKLTELQQKTQQDQEHKLILQLAVLTRRSQTFIKLLESLGNNVILNYDKTIQIKRIQEILENQNILSVTNWEQGYKLLTNQLAVPALTTEKLIEQLNQMKKSLDELTKIQSKEKDITKQKPLIIDAKHKVLTIALSPDGKYIASAGGDGDYQIKIWDPITGTQVGNDMNGHTEHIRSINYSKCGNYIVSGSDDDTIRQWNVQSQSQIGEALTGHDDWVMCVQYTIDQRQIFSCSRDATIRLWKPKTGKERVNKRIKQANSIWCMSLSPIQSDFVFGDREGIITIWDYERTKQSGQLKGHTKCIFSIQYSVDGKLIVSGSLDKTIILWDAMSKQKIQSYTGHTSIVYSVNFSPNMKQLISGERDGTVRLWNRMTGKQIGEALTQHNPSSVASTQFSLDGKYIITGGLDRTIRIMVALDL